MLRAINLLKVFSGFIFIGALTLVYAYLPIMVDLQPETSGWQLHKETFFYYAIAVFVVINIFLLAGQKLYEPLIQKEDVKAWIRGLTFILNFYMATLIGFVGVINNTQHVSMSGFAYLNYIGPILIFSWIIGLIYLAIKK